MINNIYRNKTLKNQKMKNIMSYKNKNESTNDNT